MIADNNLLVKRDLVINTSADNVAAFYFKDSFQLTLKTAGLLASLIGMMNIFARALGGMLGDWVGNRSGLQGRSLLLGLVVFMEGLALTLFSRLMGLVLAIAVFLVFGLFVCMACGVTYAVVPLVRPRAIGSASGIVGAGGNVGALLAGFLFKSERLSSANAFFYLGLSVAVSAFFVLLLRFRGAEAPSLTFAGAATIGARSAD